MLKVRVLWGGLLLGIALAAFAGMVGFYNHWLSNPVSIPPENQIFVIKKGDTLTSVANRLNQIGVLKWRKVWLLSARFRESHIIKAGEYDLRTQQSPQSLLDLFQAGEVVSYSITLVEGKTYRDYIQLMARHKKIESLLGGLSDDQLIQKLALPVSYLEGWFFPSTYHFELGETDVSILRRAHGKMRSVLEEEWSSRAPDLPYRDAYEALIMASIIEKETGIPRERGAIAGVFVRRLKLGMRLQTDPTVIYGISPFDGNLTRAHLRQPTPYNTYVIKGLPPTPIAMPGREAINAALNPEPGEALYFVAKGDGSHKFSVTLDEHNRAVQQYQKRKRVKNYRSSPQ